MNIKNLILIAPWPAQEDMKGYTEGATVNKFPIAMANLKPYVNKILVIKTTSEEAIKLKIFQGAKFNFIYIDGNHLYEFVWKDIKMWYPHLLSGGVLGGHDYIAHPGVKKAVDEVVAMNNWELFLSNYKAGEWWLIKR